MGPSGRLMGNETNLASSGPAELHCSTGRGTIE